LSVNVIWLPEGVLAGAGWEDEGAGVAGFGDVVSLLQALKRAVITISETNKDFMRMS
jgi:hypothetical protein